MEGREDGGEVVVKTTVVVMVLESKKMKEEKKVPESENLPWRVTMVKTVVREMETVNGVASLSGEYFDGVVVQDSSSLLSWFSAWLVVRVWGMEGWLGQNGGGLKFV